MKEIKTDKERTWYLVKEWETKSGFKARVQFCKWSDLVRVHGLSIHDFYTGYVQIPDGITLNENKIDVHGGLTFSPGELIGASGKWIGFDLAHLGDEDILNGEEFAIEQCELLASQLPPSHITK